MLKKMISIVILLLFVAIVYLFLTWPKNGETIKTYLGNLESYLKQTFGDQVELPNILTGDNKTAEADSSGAEADAVNRTDSIATISEDLAPEPEMPLPTASKKKLPALNDSDATLLDDLKRAALPKELLDQLRLNAIIQRFVINVDNLPKKSVPVKHRLILPPKGEFQVLGGEGDIYHIDNRNYNRYEPFIALLEAADSHKLVLIYQRYYPLFQEAYAELGQKNGLFHNRLVEVIEHLLTSPEPKGNPSLIRPGLIYKYADEGLESESGGRKILIRMGSKNAARIKAKLKELKRELILTM